MDNYIYIIIAVIIGLVVGSFSCLCVYKSLDINNTTIGGQNDIIVEEDESKKNEDLFNSLVPQMNNFGLEGHNSNDYNEYKVL
jgi:hypothetical protein